MQFVALDNAIDSDLLIKNAAKQVNTVISKEEKKERRVLTVSEAELFLSKAADTFYYNLYVLALERHTFATRAMDFYCHVTEDTLFEIMERAM